MKITEMMGNSKIYDALIHSKYHKERKINHRQLKSGRFPDIPRFTMIQNYILESLYTLYDMHNPSAFRIYLYLLRQVSGYDRNISIELRKKKIMRHMNMGTNFYNAIGILRQKNMIHTYEKDGSEYIGLNPYPDTWITEDHDKIGEIINGEVNALLGKTDDALVSLSSSSWSSSSSSSTRDISIDDKSDDEKDDDDLLKELANI
jgi:hypothetical protein